ncbi:NUDIX domain-containing protein [Fodinibius sediminis]|uniref:dATP pyrophosphohydrolase n=1 Tax=Fodinibius sediminis TaxID=1214077 RepID=A0A521DC80_9BACT|nr:NUDIX domain-containing protein [Fodinibius sediminis]SMO69309.1 dATP pyrophosphohydrolase [Fodinibius sediminis]
MERRLVDVYAYCFRKGEVELLVLKRAPHVIYSDQWRMIGGKVRQGEKAYTAGLRELREETGYVPKLFWTLPSVNHFYEASSDCIRHIPVFAAEVDPEESITLNHEHVDHKWISDEQISEHIQWPEQQRLMHLLIRILTQNQLLDEWILKK